MKAVVFDGCFGWLHPADGRTGVVLCNPFGYDALCTHRGWRRLATRLAAAGLPALRFDYPGTGDATGLEEDPERFEAWIGSIVSAVHRVREWMGVERIALVGLRFGATLAALAAQRLGDVDSLVLLSPPVAGRRYVRELRTHRQAWLSTPAGANAVPIAENDPYVEAFGFGIHGDDIARIGAVDLVRDTAAPARRVLLLDSTGSNLVAMLARHYKAHGVAVEQGGFEESDRFMVEALFSTEPAEAFRRVVAWLGTDEALGAPPVRAPALPEPVLALPRHRASERPVVFGRCFGILCEPDAPRAGAPAVLLICTGASHHIGDGRFSVLIARRLAELGVASLRMDLRGQGDSMPASDMVTLDSIYSHTSCDDATAGAEWLAARGHARVAAFGVCGGAFASLQVCAAHPNVVAGYAVNLQKFVWYPTSEAPRENWYVSSRAYWRAAFSREKWLRALCGKTSMHPLSIAGELSRRIVRRCWFASLDWVARKTGLQIAAHETRALLQSIQSKDARMRLVYGELDPGLDEAHMQLGTSLAVLRTLPNVRLQVLSRLDHALFTRQARESVMDDFVNWVLTELFIEDECARSPGHAGANLADCTPSCISSPIRG